MIFSEKVDIVNELRPQCKDFFLDIHYWDQDHLYQDIYVL